MAFTKREQSLFVWLVFILSCAVIYLFLIFHIQLLRAEARELLRSADRIKLQERPQLPGPTIDQ